MCGACAAYATLWNIIETPCYQFGSWLVQHPLSNKWPIAPMPTPFFPPNAFSPAAPQVASPTPSSVSNAYELPHSCCLCKVPSYAFFEVAKVGLESVIQLCGKSQTKKAMVRSPGALVCCRHFVPVVKRGRNGVSDVVYEVRQGPDGDIWQNTEETNWTHTPELLQSPPSSYASPSSSSPDSDLQDTREYPKSPYKTPPSRNPASRSRNGEGDELWTYLEKTCGDVASITAILHKVIADHGLASPSSPMDSPEQWKLLKHMYGNFHSGAHARTFLAPLVAAIKELGLEITDKRLATYIGSDIRTVKKARRGQSEDVGNESSSVASSSTSPSERIKPTDLSMSRAKYDAQKDFIAYMSEAAPVKSGSVSKRRFKSTTVQEEHLRYRASLEANGKDPLSLSRFYELCLIFHLKPTKADECACPHCHDLEQYAQSNSPPPSELLKHKKLVDQCWTVYRDYRDRLPEEGKGTMAMATMDYARIHQVRQLFDETEKTLSIFNFNVFYNTSSQHPYDLLSFAPQGAHFLEATFNEFLSSLQRTLDGIETLVIFSDGGLQNYGTISMVYELSKRLEKNVLLYFFAPYHGHNRSDAHFGHIKRLIRKTYPLGGLVPSKHSIDTRTPEEKVKELASQLPNTSAIIKDIDVSKTHRKFKKWQWQTRGVQSFDCYRFEYQTPDSVLSASDIPDSPGKEVFYRIYPPLEVKQKSKKTASSSSTPIASSSVPKKSKR